MARARGGAPLKGLNGDVRPAMVCFSGRDFCLKQGIEFMIFCLNQGIGLSIFVLNRISIIFSWTMNSKIFTRAVVVFR